MLKKTMIASVISIVMLFALAQAAAAQTTPAKATSAPSGLTNQTLDDRFSIRFGLYYPSIDTSVKINNEKFDLEEVLDDNALTGAILGLWRISNRFRLNFGYWAANRDESVSSGQGESIGGITIPAGSEIGASFDSSYANVGLGFSFVRNETTEFGADVGVALLGLKSELGVSIPGLPSVSFEAFDESYPLPTIGLYLTQALSPKWSIFGRIGAMGLSIDDDFEGTVVEAIGSVEFRPWKNFGLGLAYLYNSADVTIKNVGPTDELDVKWQFNGPLLYLVLGFGSVSGK
jgi:opacity protein-like surface antigen